MAIQWEPNRFLGWIEFFTPVTKQFSGSFNASGEFSDSDKDLAQRSMERFFEHQNVQWIKEFELLRIDHRNWSFLEIPPSVKLENVWVHEEKYDLGDLEFFGSDLSVSGVTLVPYLSTANPESPFYVTELPAIETDSTPTAVISIQVWCPFCKEVPSTSISNTFDDFAQSLLEKMKLNSGCICFGSGTLDFDFETNFEGETQVILDEEKDEGLFPDVPEEFDDYENQFEPDEADNDSEENDYDSYGSNDDISELDLDPEESDPYEG